MKMLTFAKRSFKEIVRDPLNLAFLFGFLQRGTNTLCLGLICGIILVSDRIVYWKHVAVYSIFEE